MPITLDNLTDPDFDRLHLSDRDFIRAEVAKEVLADDNPALAERILKRQADEYWPLWRRLWMREPIKPGAVFCEEWDRLDALG